ncbi:LysM peptidoglycan-binding domain-containing protein [Acidaminococcus intestini]|uniref:LysM peptidoglycan-binding domain-containing protein n=1 Tax=Acidaminococcus intestini TaxID=187327 RepID=UPI0004150001|nr:LysM domain-containing protein [Acidaminococcus intestini]
MRTRKKAAIIATALITAGILTAGAIWRERIKPEPTDYLTFEHVVYSGDSLWSLCERYSGYEDIQDIIQRVREDNGIKNPGALQPGQKIKVRVRKGNR